jgi:formate dehydrogenase subunit delta
MMAAPSEIRLATEIAAQFKHVPTEQGAAAIAGHVRRFWDPRMRARLIEEVAQASDDCDPLVVAAVGVLQDVSP